ncbi:MAG: BACON domain-containing carbohydrate-binding protein [Lentimicrobiaceae bacterium]|nr:BACON domain-containing carbohydrate-binding protein [Lentimicrobiaceae bacterium]
MKLKKIFPLFIAILALMTSCTDEETMTLLDEIQVSSSYVSIPEDGGSTTITLNAKESWTLEKVTTAKDSVNWLTISSTSGNAGESELTFSAESSLDGRTAQVLIHSGGQTQRINIIQGLSKIESATCAEVIAGPEGKTYQVTGVCTAITNTVYGNWYLEDETGSIYIYGTLDKKGNTKNFLSWGLEVGDEVTVQGPKSVYNSATQLVNVTVIKINKSLVKVDSVANAVLPIEGGEFIAYLTCKGQGVSVEIPENAKSWLSISSIESAGDQVVVKFNAIANAGGDRSTTIIFRTTDGTKYYSTETKVSQTGAIVDASIAEFLEAPVGNTQYRLAGVITSITNETYGNLYLRDFSGETYVYGIQDFSQLGLKEGDIITIVGKRAAYQGNPQVGGAVLESSIPVTPITIAEVLTKPDDPNTFYMVTGEITSIANETYGNLYLSDNGSEIYLYGCYPGYGATGDARKNLIANKGIVVGDILTVIATKGSYNGVDQLSNGIYFSHESSR